MRLVYLLLWILSAMCTSYAQDGNLIHFEKVLGLSQNTVYSVMQDRQGFMWIATADGLNRFDGKKIVVYKPSPLSNKGNFSGRVIRSRILEDEQSNLWFSTEIGLFRFDKRKGAFNLVYLNNNTNDKRNISVTPLSISAGILWSINGGAGVFRYEVATGHSINYSLPNSDGSPIIVLQEGASFGGDKIYVGGIGGLFEFDTLSHKWNLLNASGGISCTAVINDTLYWNQGTDIYFRKIQTGVEGKLPFPFQHKRSNITYMYADVNGNLYVGDGSGSIMVKYANASSFILIGNINQHQDANPAYPALSIFVNRSGVLFAGGDVVGLHKTDLFRPYFNVYPANTNYQNANDLFVTSIAEDESENVIIGTYQGGLHIKKKGSAIFAPLTNGKPKPKKSNNEQVSMVHRDTAGNFWLCYGNEIFLYLRGHVGYQKITTPQFTFVASELLQIFCVIPIENGWYLGTSIGLLKIEKNGMKLRSFYLSKLGNTKINCLWYESKNRLWLGFESGGIVIVDPEIGYSIVHSFLDGAGPKSFAYDRTHAIMFISTMSGLVARHVPSGKMKIFTEKDGLRNSYIYSVIIANNELWASTNRGLSRASIRYQIGQSLPSATFTNFTSKDGLPDDEFNTGAFYKGQDGMFYFGTIKGLTWFNPNDLKPNQRVPDIVFTEVLSNNSNADSNITSEYIEQLYLPYSGNEMQFKFQALEYANPEVVEYAYQMAGWDKDWVYSQQLNEVRYANLSPGNYVFRVKARKSGGDWSNDKTIAITIEPPFYRTYWFYAITGILILGLVVMVTRNISQRKLKIKIDELERQKAMDNERLRISREMHDDIGAGLTQIVLMSESAKGKKNGNSEKELTEITETSRQLVNSMGEIIWSLNPENKTVEQLMVHLREQLHQLLEYSGIAYNIHLPENGKDILLPNEMRRNILLITKETVHNAVKYSSAKNIEVNALLNNGVLSFTITDDGIGFDTEKMHTGNGLKNIRHRMNEMHGQLHIESVENKGSRFTYTIPLKPTT